MKVDSIDAPEESVEVALVENLFPMFIRKIGDLRIYQLFFAPVDVPKLIEAPRALIGILLVENKGKLWHTVDLVCRDGADSATDVRVPSDASFGPTLATASDALTRAVISYMDYDRAGILEHSLDSNPTSLRVAPNSVASFANACILSETEAEARATHRTLSFKTVSSWFQDTLEFRRQSYGRLSIPGESFTGESVVRFSELSRQSALRSSDGKVSGGFLGSDVDVNQVNWIRDSYYSMLAMNISEPTLSRDSIPYLLKWGQPSQTTGPGRTRFPNAAPVSQSLSNSVSALAMAGVYYRSTGDRSYFTSRQEILRGAHTIFDQVLASRRSLPMLFPSLYFSDGEARGDFHTGSNVAAWVAFSGMARLAGEVYGDDRVSQDWFEIAHKIHEAIDTYCVGSSPSGKRFFEGANADGTFVQGHDGEESETTLMPFYGFCGADDSRLINHASLAMTPQNPLYSRALDAIWWYNSDWNSATFPGWTTALAGASDEKQIRRRLERIRSLTDLDGSMWWWPHPYGSKDPSNPIRGTAARKCGWGGAVYLCRFINDILGISVDAPAQSVRFAPFTPWNSFVWRRAKIGWNTFDFSLDRTAQAIAATLVNRNSKAYSATIVITPEKGRNLKDARVTGGSLLGQERIVHWGRQALEIQLQLRPGQSVRITTGVD